MLQRLMIAGTLGTMLYAAPSLGGEVYYAPERPAQQASIQMSPAAQAAPTRPSGTQQIPLVTLAATESNFTRLEETVARQDLVLVELSASWCAMCKKLDEDIGTLNTDLRWTRVQLKTESQDAIRWAIDRLNDSYSDVSDDGKVPARMQSEDAMMLPLYAMFSRGVPLGYGIGYSPLRKTVGFEAGGYPVGLETLFAFPQDTVAFSRQHSTQGRDYVRPQLFFRPDHTPYMLVPAPCKEMDDLEQQIVEQFVATDDSGKYTLKFKGMKLNNPEIAVNDHMRLVATEWGVRNPSSTDPEELWKGIFRIDECLIPRESNDLMSRLVAGTQPVHGTVVRLVELTDNGKLRTLGTAGELFCYNQR